MNCIKVRKRWTKTQKKQHTKTQQETELTAALRWCMQYQSHRQSADERARRAEDSVPCSPPSWRRPDWTPTDRLTLPQRWHLTARRHIVVPLKTALWTTHKTTTHDLNTHITSHTGHLNMSINNNMNDCFNTHFLALLWLVCQPLSASIHSFLAFTSTSV